MLRYLTDEEEPTRKQLNAKRQAVDYLMGDYSGLVFVSVMWCQISIMSEVGEFTPFY